MEQLLTRVSEGRAAVVAGGRATVVARGKAAVVAICWTGKE